MNKKHLLISVIITAIIVAGALWYSKEPQMKIEKEPQLGASTFGYTLSGGGGAVPENPTIIWEE